MKSGRVYRTLCTCLRANLLFVLPIGIILQFCGPAFAECEPDTYYVDFELGSDSNPGTCTEAPWKHVPGDSRGQGLVQSFVPQPGDTIKLKGGVLYQGSFTVRSSGQPGNPIVYDGDSWPGLEGVKAMMDGTATIGNAWSQCQSPADCGGNPNFQRIYYIDLPTQHSFQEGFYEDGQFLWFSQEPNPQDPFHYDRTESFRILIHADSSMHQTRTSITDPRYFTQSDPSFYQGAYVAVWRVPNVVTVKKITGYSPATQTITHDDLGGDVYTDRDAYYCVLNHLYYLDKPGEFVLMENERRLYVWPTDSGPATAHQFGLLEQDTAILVNGKHDITVDGFSIRSFVQGIHAIGNSSQVQITNNRIENLTSNDKYAINLVGNRLTVTDNFLKNCKRAVGILSAGSYNSIERNTVERTSRQGIWLMGNDHARVIGNTVTDISGTHANGISAYLVNTNTLIADNQVWKTANSITWSGDNNPSLVSNMTLYNNLFEFSSDSWDHDMRGVTLINNLFLGGLSNSGDEESILINNIIGKGGLGTLARSHNIYLSLFWNQSSQYGWSLQDGEFVEPNLGAIFVDPANRDYRLKEGSVAVDAGVDVSSYFPVSEFPDYDFHKGLEGNARPQGSTWDIGPFEKSQGTSSPTETPLPSATLPPAQTATATIPSPGTSPTPTLIGSTLVAHYLFDEGSGSIANDSSSYTNNAALINSPSWLVGTYNGALSFNGTNQSMDCGNAPSLAQIGDSFSLSFWIRTDGNGGTEYILDKGGLQTGFYLRTHDDNTILFKLDDGVDDLYRQSNNTAPTNGDWHHIAVVVDGRTSVSLYVDGTLQSGGWGTLSAIGGITNSNHLLVGLNSSGSGYYNGDIADLYVYSRAITVGEILNLQSQWAPPITVAPTNTPIPPTATRTSTNTAIPSTPTPTPTASHTTVPPTATPTSSNTAIPPTPTRTPTASHTAVGPTATATASNTAASTVTATLSPTSSPTQTLMPTPTPTGTLPAPTPTRTRRNLPNGKPWRGINAGGQEYTDVQGKVWEADTGYIKSLVYSRNVPILGTDDDPLYQTERFDDRSVPEMGYHFPLEDGLYAVRLHFAEVYPNIIQKGLRMFDVMIENDRVLKHFDILGEAGYETALVKEFYVDVQDGTMDIEFGHVRENPKICAIELATLEGPLPNLQASPLEFAFGYSGLDRPAATKTLVLTNTGLDPLVISSVDLEGVQSDSFLLTGTFPVTLAPLQTVNLALAYVPTANGSHSATVGITSNDPEGVLTIQVHGESGAQTEMIADLEVVALGSEGTYDLRFTAPDGDIRLPGMQAALAYDIRYDWAPILSWNDFLFAQRIPNVVTPNIGGATEALLFTHVDSGPLYFAVASIGPGGWSCLSNTSWATKDSTPPPDDSISSAYEDHMVFRAGDDPSNRIQFLLRGRSDSWESGNPNQKDDSTSIYLQAFGERFLTGTDDSFERMFTNAESQNVILVDDPVIGPQNGPVLAGPSRSTIATLKSHLVSPLLDYGMLETQLGSPNDPSSYAELVQLNRHVVFPDHRFFVVADQLDSQDTQDHAYSWTAHCSGTLTFPDTQGANFLKPSGNRLRVNFFSPLDNSLALSLTHRVEWEGDAVEVPYLCAERTAGDTHFLTTLFPLNATVPSPTFESQPATPSGTAGRIHFEGNEYLVFMQEQPGQTVLVGNRLGTDATLAIARLSGGTLDYVFVVNQTGWLIWDGHELFKPGSMRSFLYRGVDPTTGLPTVTTVAD